MAAGKKTLDRAGRDQIGCGMNLRPCRFIQASMTTLTTYLRAPDKVLPGTKMAFPGIASDEDLANLIAYLKQQTAE